MKTSTSRFAAAMAIALSLGLAACSSMQVNTAGDPQANFTRYKTYAWAPQRQPSSSKPSSTVLDATIKQATDQQLLTKGLIEVPPEKADLLLSYSAVAKNSVVYGEAPGPWLSGPSSMTYPTRIGSLTLEFVDPKTNRAVWEGTAADAIGDAGASQSQIHDAIKEIVKNYPKTTS